MTTASPRALVIAAPASGAGKTTITLGLLRAISRNGVRVAAAKSGPDYIDPAFHSAAIGGPSINLDAWAETAKQLRLRAANHCATRGAELLIIEGAMGVIDGAGREGHGATADVAAALSAPLVLVVDASRQSHSALLPVLGLQVARPNLKIAGVIFNRVGSERHAAMLRASADEHGIACLGTVRRNSDIVLPERHLGLVQALETTELDAQLDAIADVVSDGVDLAALQAAASDVSVPASGSADALNRLPPLGCKIAIARDAAFSFIYPHHVADWAAQDVSLTYFSPLADEAPSLDADAVFLPGGYPELHAAKIAGATKFHRGMHSAAARGARIYGECGGYMVLGEALIDADGTRHQMTGLLPLETSFAERKRHLGYRQLKPRSDAPWQMPLSAHEFHYATIVREGAAERLFDAIDSFGENLSAMGLQRGTVSGSFAHVICPAVSSAEDY